MAIQILELLEIEARWRLADMIEVEPLDRLLAADDFVVAMAPAEAEQVIADRFGKHPQLVAVGVDAKRPVALAELGAVRSVNQRHVRIDRLGESHRPDDRELAE